jgi:hypothetical protein
MVDERGLVAVTPDRMSGSGGGVTNDGDFEAVLERVP